MSESLSSHATEPGRIARDATQANQTGALLAYALFGRSRILVLGPDSALAAVILTVVSPFSAGEPQRAVAVASTTAIVSGIELCFAEMYKRKRFGLFTRLGEQSFFATIDESVSAYLATHPVEWVNGD